jgi:hypothetical protein
VAKTLLKKLSARRVTLQVFCNTDGLAPKGVYVMSLPKGITIDDIEVELEHTSVYDEAGREVARYDPAGDLIEPHDVSATSLVTAIFDDHELHEAFSSVRRRSASPMTKTELNSIARVANGQEN